jgi:hypothetical protein
VGKCCSWKEERMSNEKELDDLLEESLQVVEGRHAPFAVTVGLPEDAAELASLLGLATAIRESPLPFLPAATKARIATAAVQTNKKNSILPAFGWVLDFGRNFSPVVVILFLMLAGIGLWKYGPFPSHTVTLADVSGTVEIASANSSVWHAASAGELVRSGSRIRTGAGGSVTLAFFEGSRSTLGSDSEISLRRVDGSWGDVLQAELFQSSGSARYNIVPFRDSAAKFLVDTPSGSASVHGTVFAVTVGPSGQALFSVERGNVVVANKSEQVTLTAGQATRSKPDQAPQPATYQFNSNETLTSVNGSRWGIAGVPFEITNETSITGDLKVGQPVIVEGRISKNGHWLADKITTVSGTGSKSQLTGKVQSIGSGKWNINGSVVLTGKTTEIGGDIKLGDTVLVVYTVLGSGDRLAAKIVKLDAVNNSSEILCAGANPQSKGETVAAQYGVSYDEIMGWYCQGFGFGEIDQAYSMSPGSGLPVSDIFALRRKGLAWDEIKRQLGMATITETSMPAPMASETASPAPTDTLAPTDTPAPTDTLAPPTDTPAPTDTLAPPTATPAPTDMPTPVDTLAPTDVPTPMDTPVPPAPATVVPADTPVNAPTTTGP